MSAINLADAYVNIIPSTKGVGKHIGKLTGQFQAGGKKSGGLFAGAFGAGFGGAIGGFAAQAVGGALRSVKDGISGMVSSFSELEDATDAASVVFGENFMGSIIKQSEEAARTMGMAKSQVIDAANTFGTFGKAAGLTGQDLVGFSTQMTKLAGDLSSFRGGSPEEAITAIGAAMRGESEPIRRYGVLLDDMTLRQRALSMGLISTTKRALTPQQRVLAAQAEILAQTKDATGDFLRTQNSTANVAKRFDATMKNLSTTVGQLVAPAFTLVKAVAADALGGILPKLEGIVPKVTQFWETFGNKVRAGLKPVGDAFNAILPKIGDVFGRIGSQAGGFLKPLVDGFTQLGPKLAPIMSAIGGVFASIGPQISGLVPQVVQLVSSFSPMHLLMEALLPIIPQIGQALQQTFGVLAGILPQVLPVVTQIVSSIAGVASNLFSQLLPVVTSVLSQLLPVLPVLAQLVGQVVSAVLPLINQLLGPITGIINGLIPPLTHIVQSVLGVVVSILPTVSALIGTAAVMLQAILAAVEPLIPPVLSLVDTVLTAILPLLPTVTQLLATVLETLYAIYVAISPLLPAITSLISAGISVLIAVLSPLINIVSLVANVIISVFNVALRAVISPVLAVIAVIAGFVSLLTQGVAGSISAVAGVFTTVFNGIFGFLQSVWNGIVGLVSGAMTGISRAVANGVVSFMSHILSIPDKIAGAFSAAGSWLYSAGREIINGLINGAGSLLSKIGEFFLNKLPGWIVGPFKSALGIASPSKLFKQFGEFTGEGFVLGLESSHRDVSTAGQKLADMATPVLSAFQVPQIQTKGYEYQSAGNKLAGLEIRGRLDLGNGLIGFIDGRIEEAFDVSARRLGAMRA